MSHLTIQQSSGRRRQRVCAALVGLTLVTGLGGCGSGDDDSAATEGTTGPTATSAEESAAVTSTQAAPPAELNGTYAVTWTVDELAEALGGDANPQAADLAEENDGTIQLVLDDGRYDMIYVDMNNDSCPGTYVVEGDRIVITATTNPAEWDCGTDSLGTKAVDAAWSLDGDLLTLTDWKFPTAGGPMYFNEAFLGTKPLERVGE